MSSHRHHVESDTPTASPSLSSSSPPLKPSPVDNLLLELRTRVETDEEIQNAANILFNSDSKQVDLLLTDLTEKITRIAAKYDMGVLPVEDYLAEIRACVKSSMVTAFIVGSAIGVTVGLQFEEMGDDESE